MRSGTLIVRNLIVREVALQLAAVAGAAGSVFLLAIALGAGTGIGLGLHEAGHVASLRGVPSALVLRGRRTFVLHAPVGERRRALVALCGPGVVVMVGGNIPGVTRTVSIAIYDDVQALNFARANATAIVLFAFSGLVLALVYALNRRVWSVQPDM